MARQRVGKMGKAYGVRMELVWSLYGICMEQHAHNTPTAGGVLAGITVPARRGAGEVPEFKSLREPAGAEGFTGWAGRGRQEAAKAKPPAGGQIMAAPCRAAAT
jgi:hypothetical protein